MCHQIKNSFTRVTGTDPRALFKSSACSPAINMQQTPLGTSFEGNTELEDLINHYVDGIRRRNSISVMSNG